MKLSQSTFVYFNYPLGEAIKRIAEAGYEGLEIWGGRPHAYRDDLTKVELRNIRSLIKDEGLEISAFIPAQFRYPTSLVSPKERVRRDSIDYIKRSINTARQLGIKAVTICPGHTLFGQSFENAWELLKESLAELGDYTAGSDTVLLLEPAHRMESDVISSIDAALRALKEIKNNRLGIVLDTGHAVLNQESLVDCIRKLVRDRSIFHIHIDDNNGLMDEHLIPGRGKIKFAPFLKELESVNYQGFLTVELGFQYTAIPDAAIYESRDYLLHEMEKIKKG